MLKILLDTNVLYSAIYYPSRTMNKFLNILYNKGEIVLCDYILEELQRTADKKMPEQSDKAKVFIKALPYKLIKTPDSFENIPKMRDEKDTPILAAALEFGCDIIVSGDKDFLSLEIENPKIMSITDFIETYQ